MPSGQNRVTAAVFGKHPSQPGHFEFGVGDHPAMDAFRREFYTDGVREASPRWQAWRDGGVHLLDLDHLLVRAMGESAVICRAVASHDEGGREFPLVVGVALEGVGLEGAIREFASVLDRLVQAARRATGRDELDRTIQSAREELSSIGGKMPDAPLMATEHSALDELAERAEMAEPSLSRLVYEIELYLRGKVLGDDASEVRNDDGAGVTFRVPRCEGTAAEASWCWHRVFASLVASRHPRVVLAHMDASYVDVVVGRIEGPTVASMRADLDQVAQTTDMPHELPESFGEFVQETLHRSRTGRVPIVGRYSLWMKSRPPREPSGDELPLAPTPTGNDGSTPPAIPMEEPASYFERREAPEAAGPPIVEELVREVVSTPENAPDQDVTPSPIRSGVEEAPSEAASHLLDDVTPRPAPADRVESPIEDRHPVDSGRSDARWTDGARALDGSSATNTPVSRPESRRFTSRSRPLIAASIVVIAGTAGLSVLLHLNRESKRESIASSPPVLRDEGELAATNTAAQVPSNVTQSWRWVAQAWNDWGRELHETGGKSTSALRALSTDDPHLAAALDALSGAGSSDVKLVALMASPLDPGVYPTGLAGEECLKIEGRLRQALADLEQASVVLRTRELAESLRTAGYASLAALLDRGAQAWKGGVPGSIRQSESLARTVLEGGNFQRESARAVAAARSLAETAHDARLASLPPAEGSARIVDDAKADTELAETVRQVAARAAYLERVLDRLQSFGTDVDLAAIARDNVLVRAVTMSASDVDILSPLESYVVLAGSDDPRSTWEVAKAISEVRRERPEGVPARDLDVLEARARELQSLRFRRSEANEIRRRMLEIERGIEAVRTASRAADETTRREALATIREKAARVRMNPDLRGAWDSWCTAQIRQNTEWPTEELTRRGEQVLSLCESISGTYSGAYEDAKKYHRGEVLRVESALADALQRPVAWTPAELKSRLGELESQWRASVERCSRIERTIRRVDDLRRATASDQPDPKLVAEIRGEVAALDQIERDVGEIAGMEGRRKAMRQLAQAASEETDSAALYSLALEGGTEPTARVRAGLRWLRGHEAAPWETLTRARELVEALEKLAADGVDKVHAASARDHVMHAARRYWGIALATASDESQFRSAYGARPAWMTDDELEAPPRCRLNLAIARSQAELARGGDAKAIAARLREAAKQFGDAELSQALASAGAESQPASPTVSVVRLGPGHLDDLESEVLEEGRRVIFRARGGSPLELEFLRVEVARGEMIYVTSTEVSARQLCAIAARCDSDGAGAGALVGWTTKRSDPRYGMRTLIPAPNGRGGGLALAREWMSDVQVPNEQAPSPDAPAQYVPISAAVYYASLVWCRLPTSEEWARCVAFAAKDGVELDVVQTTAWSTLPPARRSAITRDLGLTAGRNSVPVRWSDAARPDDGAIRTRVREIGTWLEGTPAIQGKFRHLLGNVAEFVAEVDPQGTGRDMRPLDPESARAWCASSANRLGIVGCAAFGSRECSAAVGYVNWISSSEWNALGYPDVGFRLVFDVETEQARNPETDWAVVLSKIPIRTP